MNDNFGTLFEFRKGLKSINSHKFFLMGQQMLIDWSSAPVRRRDRQEDVQRWGFKLTIKPLFGCPQNVPKSSINIDNIKPVLKKFRSDLYSWFQLMNLLVFLTSTFSRELTDGNLIQYQTKGRLYTGVGIYNAAIKKSGDSVSEYSMSLANKSQVGA